MTDLEITKLCAEAMGYEFDKTIGEYSAEQIRFIGKRGIHNEIVWDGKYDPINNDAQAMALVKKLYLSISAPDGESSGWDCYTAQFFNGQPGFACSSDNNLNRAICECVAKMKRAEK